MHQGMTEAMKNTMLGELQSIESEFCYDFRFDYEKNDLWDQDYIYINLFWPLLNERFDWSSAAITEWLDGIRDISYSAEDAGWTMDTVAEFESRVEVLAEKALEESKMYRIEWED